MKYFGSQHHLDLMTGYFVRDIKGEIMMPEPMAYLTAKYLTHQY